MISSTFHPNFIERDLASISPRFHSLHFFFFIFSSCKCFLSIFSFFLFHSIQTLLKEIPLAFPLAFTVCIFSFSSFSLFFVTFFFLIIFSLSLSPSLLLSLSPIFPFSFSLFSFLLYSSLHFLLSCLYILSFLLFFQSFFSSFSFYSQSVNFSFNIILTPFGAFFDIFVFLSLYYVYLFVSACFCVLFVFLSSIFSFSTLLGCNKLV